MQTGMVHYFDIDEAARIGVHEAILLQNIRHWVAFNKANNKNLYEGRHWTFNSYEAFSKLFPYFTPRQISYALKKLIDLGILLIGNFNKDKRDQTKWYTINSHWSCPDKENTDRKTDGSNHEIPDKNSDPTNLSIETNKIVKPLPDNKLPDKKLFNNNIYSNLDSDEQTPTCSDEVVTQVVEKFNSIAVSTKQSRASKVPLVKKITKHRIKRVKDISKTTLKTLECWVELFNRVFSSDFLIGKNKHNWSMDFNWLLDEENLTEALEGKWDRQVVAVDYKLLEEKRRAYRST